MKNVIISENIKPDSTNAGKSFVKDNLNESIKKNTINKKDYVKSTLSYRLRDDINEKKSSDIKNKKEKKDYDIKKTFKKNSIKTNLVSNSEDKLLEDTEKKRKSLITNYDKGAKSYVKKTHRFRKYSSKDNIKKDSLHTYLKSSAKIAMLKSANYDYNTDDLGTQTFVKPKKAIVNLKTAKKTTLVLSKNTKKAKKALKKTFVAAKKTALAAKVAGKILFNPVAIKGFLIIGIAAILIVTFIALITSVVSIVPTISLKSDIIELNKTYLYITELDTDMTLELLTIPDDWEDINSYNYYVNGRRVSQEDIKIYTDIDTILMYLDSKYNDYAFNAFIYGLLGGTNIKSELEYIHSQLYSYTTNKREETLRYTITYFEDGEEITETRTRDINYLDININKKTFIDYLNENTELLSEDEKERFTALESVGLYTTKADLGNPFIGQDWSISSRFGWRIHPVTNNKNKHKGIDIPMPFGTEINSVMYGEITTVAWDDGYGNYVITKWGKREVLYAHMSNINVSEGQIVNRGDIIGNVGSTGTSTGNHLHIEYIYDSENLNPDFYIKN